MRFPTSALLSLVILLPWAGQAAPEDDLRAAVTALSRTSYSWETGTRQRFKGESTEPRLDSNAPAEVKGKFDASGFSMITLQPSRELAAPVSAVFGQGDVVGQTPTGWLRRAEMRKLTDTNREVEFGGTRVRLSRVLTAALKATAMRSLSEELFDLIADAKSSRQVGEVIIIELRDRTIEQLWGNAEAKRAPDVHGTVIFKLGSSGLTEYHVVLGIGFPNSRTKKIAWSMQQWSTRITGIGSTRVDPPADAVRALEK